MTRKKPLTFDPSLSTRDHQYKLHHLKKDQRHIYHVGASFSVPIVLKKSVRHLIETNQVEASQRKNEDGTFTYIARGKKDRNPEYKHGMKVSEA